MLAFLMDDLGVNRTHKVRDLISVLQLLKPSRYGPLLDAVVG